MEALPVTPPTGYSPRGGCCSGSTCRVSPSTEHTRTRVPGLAAASERACHVSPRSLTLPQGVQGVTTTAPSPRRVLVPTCGACCRDHLRQYRMVTISHVIAAAKPTSFHGCGSRRRSTSPTSSASTDSLYQEKDPAGSLAGGGGYSVTYRRRRVGRRRDVSCEPRMGHYLMLTARAATSRIVIEEIADSESISSFAQLVSWRSGSWS
jgi:hypothetical protein